MQINNKITLELQSETFKALRFPLAVMVVFIHSFNLLENNLPNWEHITGMDINAAIQILFSKVITSIAVPTFYLISGYFFFYKVTNFDFLTYKRKLEKRFYTLLNPYLLWNVLPILWTILKIIAAFFVKGKPLSNILLYLQGSQGVRMFWDCSVWGFNTTNWLGYPTPPTGPYLFSLWFLRDLMVVVLLTPIIYYFIKRYKHWPVVFLGCCYITGVWPYIHGFSIVSMFFFCIGAYFSIYGKNMINELQICKIYSYLLYIPLLLLMWYFKICDINVSKYIYPFFIIVGVITTVNLAADLTKNGKMNYAKRMSHFSFFLYVSHIVIGLPLADVILDIVPIWNRNWICMLTNYFLKPIFAIVICCIVYAVMERACPKVLGVLTGNRAK